MRDAIDLLIIEAYREETGQRSYESILRVYEPQSGIGFGRPEPVMPRNGWANLCAGALAHIFPGFARRQCNLRFIGAETYR